MERFYTAFQMGHPGFPGIPEEVLFDNRGFPGFARAEHPPAIHPPPVEEGDFLPIMLKAMLSIDP